MPIFRSNKMIYTGGSPRILVRGTDLKELEAFYKQWQGSFAFAPQHIRDLDMSEYSQRQLDAMQVYSIQMTWIVPPMKAGLTTTKTPVQLLVSGGQRDFLANQGVHELHDAHFPFLGMLLREQYAARCPGGMTESMKDFYRVQKRGKVIDLIKKPLAVVRWPSHPDHQFLNKLLENIDLGRRSDLNLYSMADLEWNGLSDDEPNVISPRTRSINTETPAPVLEEALSEPKPAGPKRWTPDLIGKY
jgi:hypothetical protein